MKYRVLIVDDEALLVRTLSHAFRDAGFDVASSGTAEDAQKVLESQKEFDLLLREYRIGIPLNEALQNLAKRVESDELDLMVFSVIITRELGGDVSEIFEHLAMVIRERHRVMERIDTLTAQGRLQAMVCGAIPFFLYGLLFYWQPDYVMPLFETFAGKIAIYVVVLLQVFVIILVRKLINIKI